MSIRNALFVVLVVLIMPGGANSQVGGGQLAIDDETITQSIVDAYGKSFFARNEYCPPISDKFVQDSFVRDVLMARQSKIDEIELRNKILEKAIKPLHEKIERIEILVKKNAAHGQISQVYKKQIQRIELDIEELERQSEKYYKYRTRFSINSSLYNQLRILPDASEADKDYLVTMMGFVELYTDRLREMITNEMAQNRYKTLVEEKDKRFVDVYVFKYRSLYLSANDDSTVEMATDYLRERRNEETKKSMYRGWENIAPNIYTFRSPVSGPRWSRLNELEAVSEKPSTVIVGATFVQKDNDLSSGDNDAYQFIYIDEIKHYPLIGLNEDTPHSSPSTWTMKHEEYQDRLDKSVSKLRALSLVSHHGRIVSEAEDYAECPPRR